MRKNFFKISDLREGNPRIRKKSLTTSKCCQNRTKTRLNFVVKWIIMDFFKLLEKKSLTAERLLKTTNLNRDEINLEKAKEIVSLIYALANLAVKHELRLATQIETKTTN